MPTTTLRFGSFEPSSAPPRLWSDRVESEEAFERELPVLGFECVVDTIRGGLGGSAISIWGDEEVSRQVATPPRTQHSAPSQEVTQLVMPGLSGGALGQAASGCSPTVEEGDSGQVALVSFSSLGGGLGQVASTPPPPSPAWLPFLHLVFGPGGQQRGAGLPPLAMRRQHTLSHG